MLTVAKDQQDTPPAGEVGGSMLDGIVREGARRMLAAALEAEVAAYIGEHADQLDQDGNRLVVRNGRHQAREVLTSSGAIEVVAPRVNDKRAWMRPPVNGRGSPRRSWRRGVVSRPRSPRCCRCCTCTGCRRWTSGRR